MRAQWMAFYRRVPRRPIPEEGWESLPSRHFPESEVSMVRCIIFLSDYI
jgi:hypothetical protein